MSSYDTLKRCLRGGMTVATPPCQLFLPHLMNPLVCANVPQGLEEQLLAELVRAERPELEESRDSLITSISSDKRQLLELESKILRLLKESSGHLLDDETLIATLNSAKSTSGAYPRKPQQEVHFDQCLALLLMPVRWADCRCSVAGSCMRHSPVTAAHK